MSDRWSVVLGDCVEWMKTIDDRSVDVLITDPPYSEAVHARSIRRTYLTDVAEQPCRRLRKHEFGFEHLSPELRKACAEQFARITKRWVLVFSDTEMAHAWKEDLEAVRLEHVRYGFWLKDRAMPQISGDRPGSRVEQLTIAHRKGRKQWNGGGLGNVWQHPVVANCNGQRNDRVHTAQKPESLMLELVELFTNPGELVCDPFSGSGTTGVAALRLGRRFVGCELNPEYASIARDRLTAEETGSTLHDLRAGQLSLLARSK